MMIRQTQGYLYNRFGRWKAFMAILCILLVSCSTTKKEENVESQQVQPELRQQKSLDKNRSEKDEIIQKSESKRANKHPDHSFQPNVQQQTTASNYPSELKSARTSQEIAAQTEEKLNASLRDFDEVLLKKNKELSVLSKRDGGSAGNGSANRGGTESGQGEENERGSGTVGGGLGQSIAKVKSQDNNIDNDDVIARQIREAAEKESDPELKKKLWIEYEKYKSGKK